MENVSRDVNLEALVLLERRNNKASVAMLDKAIEELDSHSGQVAGNPGKSL